MKITINTDWIDGAYTFHIVNEIKKRNLLGNDNEIVFNIDSIHNKGIKKGKRLTIYWEIEDYRFLGSNQDFYKDCGLLYIGHKRYLPYYPAGTKVMYLACDPDYHKEVKIDKLFNLVFVGGVEKIPFSNSHFLLAFWFCNSEISGLWGIGPDFCKTKSLTFLRIERVFMKIIEDCLWLAARIKIVMLGYFPPSSQANFAAFLLMTSDFPDCLPARIVMLPLWLRTCSCHLSGLKLSSVA